jgi:hypothetical protein
MGVKVSVCVASSNFSKEIAVFNIMMTEKFSGGSKANRNKTNKCYTGNLTGLCHSVAKIIDIFFPPTDCGFQLTPCNHPENGDSMFRRNKLIILRNVRIKKISFLKITNLCFIAAFILSLQGLVFNAYIFFLCHLFLFKITKKRHG